MKIVTFVKHLRREKISFAGPERRACLRHSVTI
jgi:hypothetical protein